MELISVEITIALGLFGLVFGSFAGASVWRLRARQLEEDAHEGEKVAAHDKKQVAKLQKKNPMQDRSVCLHCGHELAWYDLIPLVSWLSVGGKCRYCRKPIGLFEPIIELGVAAFFVISYIYWPYLLITPLDIIQFGVWLIAGVGLAILFAYDSKWFLLPNIITFPLIGLGAVNAFIVLIDGHFSLASISSIAISCAVLSGLYYLIYVFSQHQWVGFGDVKLGLALGLLLSNWELAVLALFLANLIGTVIFLPSLLVGKIKRQARIPFGPLLIAGWAISGIFGMILLRWYIGIVL